MKRLRQVVALSVLCVLVIAGAATGQVVGLGSASSISARCTTIVSTIGTTTQTIISTITQTGPTTTVHDTVTVTVGTTTTPPPPPPPADKYGVAVGYRLNSRSSVDQDYEIARAVDLHATTLRIDGANGVVIDKLVTAGIKPVVIIGSNPNYPWATSATQYGLQCGSLATTYAGRVKAWEVLNEPDRHGWTPQTYLPYLQSCYQAVKSADPNAEVWPGGIWKWRLDDLGPPCKTSPTSSGTLCGSDWYQQLYAAGAKDFMDAINVHAYDPPSDHGWWSAWDMTFGWAGGDYATYNIRAIADSFGDSAKPIVVTEAGDPVPKYSEAGQANTITQALSYADGVGTGPWHVKTVFIYCVMVDDGTNSDGYSMIRSDRTFRPSYFAYQAAAAG